MKTTGEMTAYFSNPQRKKGQLEPHPVVGLIDAMQNAEKSIDLSFGYFYKDPERWFIHECRKALEKGVSVRLIVGREGEEGAQLLRDELNDQISVKVGLGKWTT